MEKTVNLDNLRLITGGDAAFEAELFGAFLECSCQCIADLTAALLAENDVAWNEHAHTLKGICANLGAHPLAELCAKAQLESQAPPKEKKLMLIQIENEYRLVCAAIADLAA